MAGVGNWNGTRVVLRRGDITRERVDAVVNAANSGLRGGGGVDGAIHRAGGPAIMAACDRLRGERGGCPTGEAVVTGAGDLPARWVVHAVGPVWRGGGAGEAALLRAAHVRSLEAAAAAGARTIAFPALSTGAYGYPVAAAAREALTACRDWARRQSAMEEIRFVLFSEADLAAWTAALEGLDKAP